MKIYFGEETKSFVKNIKKSTSDRYFIIYSSDSRAEGERKYFLLSNFFFQILFFIPNCISILTLFYFLSISFFQIFFQIWISDRPALLDAYFLLSKAVSEFVQQKTSLAFGSRQKWYEILHKNVLSCVVHTISGVVHNSKYIRDSFLSIKIPE